MSRDKARSPISAGRAAPSHSAPAVAGDPWASGDPWSAYLQSRPTGAASSTQRQATGPTGLKLEEHASRLARLEEELSAVKASSHKVEAGLAETNTELRRQVSAVRSDFTGFQNAFREQLQESVESLKQSQLLQQQQMQSNMNEIKLLLQATQAPRAGQKRPQASQGPMEQRVLTRGPRFQFWFCSLAFGFLDFFV